VSAIGQGGDREAGRFFPFFPVGEKKAGGKILGNFRGVETGGHSVIAEWALFSRGVVFSAGGLSGAGKNRA
jgi:hypothetical protein